MCLPNHIAQLGFARSGAHFDARAYANTCDADRVFRLGHFPLRVVVVAPNVDPSPCSHGQEREQLTG